MTKNQRGKAEGMKSKGVKSGRELSATGGSRSRMASCDLQMNDENGYSVES